MSESSDVFIAIGVMPTCTIMLLVSAVEGDLEVAIICFIIGTLSVFLMGADVLRQAVTIWLIAISLIGFALVIMLEFTAALVCGITVVAVFWVGGPIVEEIEKKQREEEKKEEERLERRRELEKREREEFERKQKEKGLVKFVRGDREEKWGTPEQVKEWREVDIGLSNNFADYTPREFEMFVGDLFRKMGYDVELTPSTGDYGVDVVAKKDGNTVAIQVKKYEQGNLIGTQVVQQTLGAMWKVKADQSIIVTTSGFTVYAKEQAKEAPIELWDKKALHEMVRKYMV